MFTFDDADPLDVATGRRQGALAMEYTKANFSVTGDVPLQYSAVLKKGLASSLVVNNIIAQIGKTGLVNTVLQVVQKGLALVLYRVTQSSQVDCPLFFQWDFEPDDEVFGFSRLGLRQILEGPGRVDHTFLDNIPSVITPAFDSVTAVVSTLSTGVSDKYVSAITADGFADGSALKNLMFQDATKIDPMFMMGTKQITQNALNKVMSSIDPSSPVRNFVFFQPNVLEAFLGSNFGDFKQARPTSSTSKVKSVSVFWGSDLGVVGAETITNDMCLASLVTLAESWDAISRRLCSNGRGFFTEAMAGVLDLFNPLRSNVLPFSPAFNASWIHEMVVKVADVMRMPRLVVFTEGELVKELTTIFFGITHENVAREYRKWTELWPMESQLWLAECARPKSHVPVFGGFSLAPAVSNAAVSGADTSGQPPLKKVKARKVKAIPAPAPTLSVATPSVAVPSISTGGSGGGGGSTRATRRNGAQVGVSPGKLCQYHVRYLFGTSLNKCTVKPKCSYTHQSSVKTYHKSDMLAWADVALLGHSDYDDVVDAIKAKA
jgi:hypothetical protein